MADEGIERRYRLTESLGGSMSEVWLADDIELGRRVVVKLLGPDAERARFEREARAAASLSHPNIVQIYAYGEWDGRPYMVLEYLPGGTLEDRLRGSPLPDAETLRIARELAFGLEHAHARGLVHRDLKPANVLFDGEGHAKIADLGIARLGGARTLTKAGTVLGTAAYISPEQAAGEQATPASDVYSFGVMLFLMLTGRLPFLSEDAFELVRMHQAEPAPSVAGIRPDAPARLESITAAALAKNPFDRPRDGGALAAELGASSGEPTTVFAAAPGAEAIGGPRRIPLVALVAALLVLAAGGAGLALIATHTGSTRAPATSRSIRTHASTRQTTTEASVPSTAEQTTARETTEQQPTTPTTQTLPTTLETLPTTIEATTTVPTETLPITTAPPPPPPAPGG